MLFGIGSMFQVKWCPPNTEEVRRRECSSVESYLIDQQVGLNDRREFARLIRNFAHQLQRDADIIEFADAFTRVVDEFERMLGPLNEIAGRIIELSKGKRPPRTHLEAIRRF